MIQSKDDLKIYLQADKVSLNRKGNYPRINDYIWKYQILLRHCEYYINKSGGIVHKLLRKYYSFRLQRLGLRCGFTVPPNTCDKGLNLAHTGTIVISSYASIGENCRIHAGVNIGTAAGTTGQAPKIGNNVLYIGPGAKIFGPITLADGVVIGANAVVNRDCLEKNATLVGVPAKVINHKGSEGFLIRGSENCLHNK